MDKEEAGVITLPFLGKLLSRIFYGQKKATLCFQRAAKSKLGNDLLSHTLVHSTIGDEELNF